MKDRDFLDARGLHMNDVVDILKGAFEEKELPLNHGGAISIENVRCDDDVRDAGFIFEADENETFRGSGPLARNDAAGHADVAAIGDVREIDGAENAEAVQSLPAIGHRVWTDGQAGTGEVCNETFFVRHDVER